MQNYLQISSSIEKRIRETRKKDIIQKISDLNSKLSPPKETYITPQKEFYHSSSVSDFSKPETNFNTLPKNSEKGPNNFEFSNKGGNYKSKLDTYVNREEKNLPNYAINQKANTDSSYQGKDDSFNQKNFDIRRREGQQRQKNIAEAVENSKKEHSARKSHLRKEIDALRKEVDRDKIQYDRDTQSLKSIISEEEGKLTYLSTEHKKLKEAYQSQVNELNQAVSKMRGDYESKLKDFEKLLTDSGKTILTMKEVIKKEEEQRIRLNSANKDNENEDLDRLERALEEKNKALENIEKDFHDIKISYKKKLEAFINVIQSKDEIIDELTKNSELRDEEIRKIEEFIKSFKLLFEKYNEEKKLILQENEKLNQELEQYKQLILMGQNLMERNGQLNGDENDENYNGEEDQNDDMNDRNEEEPNEDEDGLAVAS